MKKKVIYSPRYIRNLPQWSLQQLHDYLVDIYPMMDNHWAQCALGNDGHPDLPITENQFYFMNKDTKLYNPVYNLSLNLQQMLTQGLKMCQ